MAELETMLRHNLKVVVVVNNDRILQHLNLLVQPLLFAIVGDPGLVPH